MSEPDARFSAVVSVMLPVAIPGPYSYGVPEGMTVEPGDWVVVPLGPRNMAGVVWDGEGGAVDPSKLRGIVHRFDAPLLPQELRRFIEWVADYTMSEAGGVLKMVLRTPEVLEPPPPRTGVRATGFVPDRMTDTRARVLEVAEGGLAFDKRALADLAGVSAAVISGLVKAGALEVVDLPRKRIAPALDPDHDVPVLTDAQSAAADALAVAVADRIFGVHVLDGVTGSGKTEV
ncbi:MAG: primosomal protein N', partial [Rhodobiaceae bacterium]|nr:primosomal protein N' [Rhodobiaceae bacterium]